VRPRAKGTGPPPDLRLCLRLRLRSKAWILQPGPRSRVEGGREGQVVESVVQEGARASCRPMMGLLWAQTCTSRAHRKQCAVNETSCHRVLCTSEVLSESTVLNRAAVVEDEQL